MENRKNNPNYSRTSTTKWKKIREAAKKRDEYRCVQCGRALEDGFKLEVDHIIPWIDHGEDSLDNAVTLCKDYCHRAKTDQENAQRRFYKPRPSIDWV